MEKLYGELIMCIIKYVNAHLLSSCENSLRQTLIMCSVLYTDKDSLSKVGYNFNKMPYRTLSLTGSGPR